MAAAASSAAVNMLRRIEKRELTSLPEGLQDQNRQNWHRFGLLIQKYSDALFCGQQRLFLAMFCYDAGLCMRHEWDASSRSLMPVPLEEKPTATHLYAFLMGFLGIFLANNEDFDHSRFLRDAGVADTDDSDDDGPSDNDPTVTDAPAQWAREEEDDHTAKYIGLTFSAAPLAVLSLLRALECCEVYSAEELQPCIDAATAAYHQLPACAMLNSFLPGPLNLVKHLVASRSSLGTTYGLRICAMGRKFRLLVPLFKYRQELERMQAAHLQVVESHECSLFVVGVRADGWTVDFSTEFSEGHSTCHCRTKMNISVEFDPELARLMQPDMCLTGCFDKLSDGSWCFHTPVSVHPPLIANDISARDTHHSNTCSQRLYGNEDLLSEQHDDEEVDEDINDVPYFSDCYESGGDDSECDGSEQSRELLLQSQGADTALGRAGLSAVVQSGTWYIEGEAQSGTASEEQQQPHTLPAAAAILAAEADRLLAAARAVEAARAVASAAASAAAVGTRSVPQEAVPLSATPIENQASSSARLWRDGEGTGRSLRPQWPQRAFHNGSQS